MLHKNFLIFIRLIFAGSNLNAQVLTSGLWQGKSEMIVNGAPLPIAVAEQCMSPEQAQDPKATIASSLKKTGCSITEWKITDGKLDAVLNCKSNELKARGDVHGTFTPTSYDLKGSAHGFYKNILPVLANIKLNGRWIKDCVPESQQKN